MATQEEINRASQIESEASKQTTESHGWVIEVSQVPEVGGRSDLVGLWFAVAWIAGTVYEGERPIGSYYATAEEALAAAKEAIAQGHTSLQWP